MNFLIIGNRGQLGTDFERYCKAESHRVYGADLPEVDILDPASLRAHRDQHRPDIIVNCSAYTNVDSCETEKETAMKINAEGVKNLAQCAEEGSIPLIHFSTDYVFDGSHETPYEESAEPNPNTVYGQSKLAGENNVRTYCSNYYIIRIAWLYGMYGGNFVKTMTRVGLQAARKQTPVKVVDDQRGSPTWTVDICKQVLALVNTGAYGIYHCTSEGDCTWYEFTRYIYDHFQITASLLPCSTSEYPRPAPRPPYSVLENSQLKQLGINTMPHWKSAFDTFFQKHGETLLQECQL